MNATCFRGMIGFAMLFSSLFALATSPLPFWLTPEQQSADLVTLDLPEDLSRPAMDRPIRYLILRWDENWKPDWKQAAFEIKALVVAWRAEHPDLRVGLEGSVTQVDALMSYKLAPYVDGYVFKESPYIPDGDPTGKLWQRAMVSSSLVLKTLLDAASLGIELVILEGAEIGPDHQAFLETIRDTSTGSLDIQPEIRGIAPDRAHFFFDPAGARYHLSLYAQSGAFQTITFSLDVPVKAQLMYPNKARFGFNQYGEARSEITTKGESDYYLFELEPQKEIGPTESLEIVATKGVDPWELIVKNQVFRDRQKEVFTSLEVDERFNYRYQDPSGVAVDVTFDETVFERQGKPLERVRRKLYINGVEWRYKDLPDLPLVIPEEVRRPTQINMDPLYDYEYLGDDEVDGHACWRVRFIPNTDETIRRGVIWIDQETGAHRKMTTSLGGLKHPQVGHEVTSYFDWVEQDGQKFWTEVHKESICVITAFSTNVALRLDSRRSHFRFNQPDIDERVQAMRASDMMIVQETPDGYRYLVKKDGQRVVSEDDYLSKKFLLGGVLLDPSLDFPIPLAGFNYLDLNFLDDEYEVNLFVAGAVNTAHISKNNFLGSRWDVTAGLFTTLLYFSDSVYENGEEQKDLEVKQLWESFRLSAGYPVSPLFKISAQYGLDYLDFKEGDDTSEAFVIPHSTFEHELELNFRYDLKTFSASLELFGSKRSSWEAWGVPEEAEPVEEQFYGYEVNMAWSKRMEHFQTVTADVRYMRGWNLDRFSRFGFGFFENTVSGFGTSGIDGDEAVRCRLGYDVGLKGLAQLNLTLDGARAYRDLEGFDPVDLAGVGVAVNFLGPWKTLMRLNVGYGVYSSLEGEEGDVSGQILFLRIL